jgi:ribosome-associated protein
MSLLKICGIAGTGGQAGILIAEGGVTLNGETEFRKRAKLRKGDIVECRGEKIEIA